MVPAAAQPAAAAAAEVATRRTISQRVPLIVILSASGRERVIVVPIYAIGFTRACEAGGNTRGKHRESREGRRHPIV